MGSALAVSTHSGWAWSITVGREGGTPAVLRRDRWVLWDDDATRMPYHAAKAGDPDDAEELVRRVWAGAAATAHQVLADRLRSEELVGVVVLGEPRDVPDVAAVLRSHALMHACEGELYRAAVADAAADLGLPTAREAVDAVDVAPWSDALAAARATLGAPWAKEHRVAAAAGFRLLDERPG